MTQLVVVARLRDLSGALERLLGLLRRRALPVDGLSVYRSQDDILEVAVRFGELSTPWDRVEAELNELVDLISVRRLDTDACGEAREFALARTDGEVGPWPEALVGIVRHQADDAIELTGSPAQIDRALDFMAGQGVLVGSARSGEIFPPRPSDVTKDPTDGDQ